MDRTRELQSRYLGLHCISAAIVFSAVLSLFPASFLQQTSNVNAAENPLFHEAYWIWNEKDALVKKHVSHFFSKKFRVDAPAAAASVQITAEGPCTVFLNGHLLGVDDRWYNLSSYDLKPFLETGENELRVRVSPNNWYAGLFGAARILLENGKYIEIVTDRKWQAWTQDDPVPGNAVEIVKGVDGGFWNNVTPVEMPALHNRVNTGLDTPNIPWAKPYAGSKPKVLVILPRKVQMDVVELMRRLDMEVTVVFSDYYREDRRQPFFRAVQGALKKDIIDNLRKAFKGSYDVILLGSVPQDVFYGAVAGPLEKLVKEGTSLIYTRLPLGPKKDGQSNINENFVDVLTNLPAESPPSFLEIGMPFERLPGFQLSQKGSKKGFSEYVSLCRLAKGRIARIHKPGRDMLFTPDDGKDDLRYEYYQLFLIKLVLWAIRSEPEVRFVNLPEKMVWNKHDLKKKYLELRLENEGGKGAYSVVLAVRAAQSVFDIPDIPMAVPGLHRTEKLLQPVYEARFKVKPGEDVRSLLPDLPDGEYFVDAQISQKGKKINWAVTHLKVNSELRIEKTVLKPEFLDYSSKKTAQLAVTVFITQEMPAEGKVRISIIDNHDRLVHDEEVLVHEGVSQFSKEIDVPIIPTTLLNVRAELEVKGKTADLAVTPLTAVHHDRERFAFVGWAHAGTESRQQKVLARVLAGLGFNAQRGTKGSFERLEVADIRALPGAGGRRTGQIDTDPKVTENEREKLQALARKNLPFDPFAYVTSDEVRYGGGEGLPKRVRQFQHSLKAQYGTIDALNKQWDSGFSSFENIPAITGKVEKGLKDEAKKTLNFSPMVDQYLENCRVYAENFGMYQNALHAVDPSARFGIESVLWPWPNSCFDWYQILQNIRFFSPYGREGDLQTYEYARSFARPDTVLGMTYGAYIYNGFVRRSENADLEFQRWRPWNALMRGFDCVYWYSNGPAVESGVGMGMEPYPALVEAADQIREINRGFYTLLKKAEKQYDPVAVHYSVRSNKVSTYFNDFGNLPWNVHMLIRILQDCVPVSYTFISTQQIEAGALSAYKVLIMPLSQSVSLKEAENIRQFVEKGGVVVADIRPGICDGHGKFGANHIMQALFGIGYEKTLGRAKTLCSVTGRYMDIPFENRKITIPLDPAARLNGAAAALKADGDIPLVISNRVGKGTAVCLNMPFNNFQYYPTPDSLYSYLADPQYATIIGNVLKTVLKAHQFKRIAEVQTPDGKWPWGLETWYAVDGQAKYVGLTKRRGAKDEKKYPIEVLLPDSGHLYDMFSGEYLGSGNIWSTTVSPADVQLLSILPYRVEGLEISFYGHNVERGATIEGKVQVETGKSEAVRHVVHLDVIRPDGSTVGYLARNLEIKEGNGVFAVPIALNEPLGKYELIFTDVATRTKRVITINVV